MGIQAERKAHLPSIFFSSKESSFLAIHRAEGKEIVSYTTLSIGDQGFYVIKLT